MEKGDIVAPKNETFPELYDTRPVLRSGCSQYDKAIVISTEPFILVSEQTDMRWESTVEEKYFEVIGKADEALLNACMRRLKQ